MEAHLQVSYRMNNTHDNYMLYLRDQKQGMSRLTKGEPGCQTLSVYNKSELGYQYKQTKSGRSQFLSQGRLLIALAAIPNKSEELKQYLDRKSQVGQINPRLLAEYLYKNQINISNDDIMRSLVLTEVYIYDLSNNGCKHSQ
jgi:hypothetical protein